MEPQLNRRARMLVVRYSTALLAFLVSFLLRKMLSTWLHDRDYIVFNPAIILVTFFAGLGPGLLTLLLSSAAVWYYFTPQYYSFTLDVDAAIGFATFMLSGAVGIGLVHWLRISMARSEVERAKALTLTRQQEADLDSLTQLNDLGLRLAREDNELDEGLNDILDGAIALLKADRGTIQLFDSTSGALTIAAHRGFEQPFLQFFSSVRDAHSACGAAMDSNEPVVVEDVAQSEIFSGHASRKAMIDAGVRAVISMPLASSTGQVLGVISVHFAIPHRPTERSLHFAALLNQLAAHYLERKRAQETEKLLMREINHRSSNQLAVISAIARQCLSGSSFSIEAFEARLSALARANHELSKFNWQASLAEIVRSTLEPFAARTKVEGNDVMLGPRLAQGFSLALHELATNAMKYGALSNLEGSVHISWAVIRDDSNAVLAFRWQEQGGPPVTAPERHGFGTLLLKATFSDVRIDYERQGLRCEISVLLHDDTSDLSEGFENSGNSAPSKEHEETGLPAKFAICVGDIHAMNRDEP